LDEERHRLANNRIERDALIGRTSTTLTELRSTGIVVLGQRHFEASSQAGYVAADTPIEVIGLTAFGLILREGSLSTRCLNAEGCRSGDPELEYPESEHRSSVQMFQ
jgi:hypothetical protein